MLDFASMNGTFRQLSTSLPPDNNNAVREVEKKSVNGVKFNVPEILHYAVWLRDVSFNYGSKTILDKVNLCVPHGKIYALLGSSGSGKTTLLRCVLGRLKPRSGDISLLQSSNGSKIRQSFIPGQGVGFMPQETALFEDYTIKSTLRYFGQLYGLTIPEIGDKSEFLAKLLNLPPEGRLISSLSGGQKRRVSLAIALIHNPPLLILDEPTVGVDPILRETIWKYLTYVSRQLGTTVIITTHYIEEARAADLVGFLRFGKLLAEDSPETVMRKYNSRTLEQVFNKICKLEDRRLIRKRSIDVKRGIDEREKKPFITAQQVSVSEVLRLRTLVRKNFKRFFCGYKSIGAKVVFPLFQLAVAAVTLNINPVDVPVAVHNGDARPVYSQLFLDSIDSRFVQLIHFDSERQALDSVRQGRTFAAIVIPENFTFSLPLRRHLYDMDNESRLDNVAIYQDTTNFVVSMSFRQNILDAFTRFTNKLIYSQAKRELDFERGSGDYEDGEEEEASRLDFRLPINFRNYNERWKQVKNYIPEAMVQITFFAMTAFSSVSLVLEKKQGTFERTLVTGVGTNTYVLSHIAVQTLILLAQLAVIYLGFGFLAIEANGPVLYTVPQSVVNSVCGMSYGLLCSALFESEVAAMIMCFCAYFPLMFISGMLWPIETLPYYVQKVAAVLPIAVPSMALEEIFYRGSPFTHPLVLWGLVVSATWTTIFLTATFLLFKFRNYM